MKSILLLENRKGRQAQFLDLSELKDLRSIKGFVEPNEEDCEKWLQQINQRKFDLLKNYSLLIIHKTAIEHAEVVQELSRFCSDFKIDLILFSGGLSQIVYGRGKHQSLAINSGDFYSSRLVSFIRNYTSGKTNSLLELIYGENWKLETLLRYRMIKKILEEERKSDGNLKEIIRREDELEEIDLENNFGISPDSLDREINKILTSL